MLYALEWRGLGWYESVPSESWAGTFGFGGEASEIGHTKRWSIGGPSASTDNRRSAKSFVVVKQKAILSKGVSGPQVLRHSSGLQCRCYRVLNVYAGSMRQTDTRCPWISSQHVSHKNLIWQC